ncbi:hypothetical protein [Cryptosporangium sp. NPDC048952]|uniref:hypothetical protein n=1 Tax=Cryptosporangium sp. NPDC048952 TaxID=3363961 RepID=UPI0037123338
MFTELSVGLATVRRESAPKSTLIDRLPIQALVIGNWGDPAESAPPIAEIAELADRMPDLRALFLADMTPDECEISWIEHCDITPLFAAFPKLEVLRVRGSKNLEMQPVTHTALRELAFETGGLPAGVARAVAASDFPALEHLELWFGEEGLERLGTALPDVRIDTSESQFEEAEDERYVAVGE